MSSPGKIKGSPFNDKFNLSPEISNLLDLLIKDEKVDNVEKTIKKMIPTLKELTIKIKGKVLDPKEQKKITERIAAVQRIIGSEKKDPKLQKKFNKYVKALKIELRGSFCLFEIDHGVVKSMPATGSHLLKAILRLEKSQSSSELSQYERIECTPRRAPGGGVCGSYIVGKEQKRFLLKPTSQEPGAKGNLDHTLTEGVLPGTGALREVLVQKIARMLKICIRIPETGITKIRHTQFGIPEKPEKFAKFSKELHINLGKRFVLERKPRKLIADIYQALKQKLDEYTEKAPLLSAEANEYLESQKKKKDFNTFKEKMPKNVNDVDKLTCGEFGEIMYSLHLTMTDQNRLLKMIAGIQKELLLPKECMESYLTSAQAFVEGCRTLQSIKDSGEVEKINPKEFEQFLIDLIVVNNDRHLGNVLVRPRSKKDLKHQLKSKGVPHKLIDRVVSDEKKELNDQVATFMKKLDPKIRTAELERVVSNLFYAETNGLNEVYFLILIDHGACIPDPLDKKGLSNSRHGWTALKQSQVKFSGIARSKILELDVEKLIRDIKSEQEYLTRLYGKKCAMSPAHFHLIRLNLMFVQLAVKANLLLDDMDRYTKFRSAMVKERELSPMRKIFKEHIESPVLLNQKVEWTAIENVLKEEVEKLRVCEE